MSNDNEASATGAQTKIQAKMGRPTKKLEKVTIEVEAKLVGRDNVPIQPSEVYKLAALGCLNKDIANYFGVEESNISRHFAAELAKGREDVKISLRRAMMHNAVSNNNAAVQIFLAKNLLGMSDNGMVTDDDKILPWNTKE
jgi:hypothetical protein